MIYLKSNMQNLKMSFELASSRRSVSQGAAQQTGARKN